MRIIHIDANGWRARFDDGFDDVGVARVADALGLLWADRSPGATVYVGFDTRPGAPEHASLAASVMASYGLDVCLSDRPVPTPVVGWSAARDDACAGAVVLTASEDSFDWGGMLVRGADGGPMGTSMLAEVERLVSGDMPAGRGEPRRADLAGPYVDALLAQVDVSAIAAASPLVVVDSLFGAASALAPRAFARAGCEVVALHDATAGSPAGLAPAPREPWARGCARAVTQAGAACGIVLDGDGDRVALVDERGALVGVHDLLPLLVEHLSARGLQGRVVATAASSARVRRQAQRLGLEFTSVPVGFERIHDEFAEGDVVVAGEEYGGICVPDWLAERDGLLAGLLAVEMLALRGQSLSELVAEADRLVGRMAYGQRDVLLDVGKVQALHNVLPGLNPPRMAGRAPVAVSHADGLRLEFADDSWVMLRPARTQAVARAYAEAPSLRACEELLDAACDLARAAL